MTLSHNDKKQKRVQNGGDTDSLLPTPMVGVVSALLSFGTIVKEFPDFLFCVLPYIADRVIWNSIAFSNKELYKKSKAILPPWPLNYKLLPFSGFWSWSPCGTRFACTVYRTELVIFDRRHGPLRNHLNAHGGKFITDLKYSPDGSFLVSAAEDDHCIRVWDNTRNYEQLQEWNMAEEVGEELTIVPLVSVSSCSTYIAVSIGTCTFLKDIENRGSTIKSLMPPFAPRIRIDTIKFSSNDRAIFICRKDILQVWHPYLDDDDEDYLTTLARYPHPYNADYTHTFSNDNTMVAIYDWCLGKGTVWSIDIDHKCLTQKFNFTVCQGLYFTPDDKSIVCNTSNGPQFRSIVRRNISNTPTNFLVNGNITKHDLLVTSCSPYKRQLIVQQFGTDGCFVASYCIL